MKRTMSLVALLLLAGVLVAQEETKQTYTRQVLIEQFTTVNCGWCPPGAERITDAVSGMSNVIWIKHHAGFGEDFLTNDVHRAMLAFYGGSTFAPAMMVDRTRFDASDAGPVGSVGQVSDIRSVLAQAKQIPTYCKVMPVNPEYNPETRELSGFILGRFGEDNAWNENTRITIYLIEDNIVGEQHDYTSHGNWTNYVHMGTVRAAITDKWGDTLTVNGDNRSFVYAYQYVLPEEFNYRQCKVLAFVYQYDASDINKCPVLNAAISRDLQHVLGIAENDGGSVLRLYPNPAVDGVVLESDEAIGSVQVIDMQGRELFATSGKGGSQMALDTRDFPQGVYLVRITTAGGTATRQLNVVK